MMRVALAEVDIDAPIDVVWSVMADVDRYGEWNPFVTGIDVVGGGPAVAGVDVVLHVRSRRGIAGRTTERLTRFEPYVLEVEFLGPIARLGMIQGRRSQTLVPVDAACTRYRSEERFGGWGTLLLPLGTVQDGFERHAAALKARAEALFAQSQGA